MLFDLSDKSIKVLKGMLGKCLRQIYSVHMDYSLRDHQMTIYEELVWSLKDGYIHMKAEEIDTDNDYYSFSIKEQELPDPLPYVKDEWGEADFFNPISSISIWSKISKITIHSLEDPKQEEPPYIAVLFHLESGQVIGVTPNCPMGFNLYMDTSAWELVKESVEQHSFTMEDFQSTLTESDFIAAGRVLSWNEIPKSLRAITVRFNKEKYLCEWFSFFEKEPTEAELENQQLIAEHYFSDIDQGPLKFNKHTMVKPNNEKIEIGDSYLLYHRYEEGIQPPPVRLKEKMNRLIIHSSAVEALNGLVTENLEEVDINFTNTDHDLTWYAKFESQPDKQELKFQQLAAERFLSSFGLNNEPKVVILVGDASIPYTARGIFRRFRERPV